MRAEIIRKKMQKTVLKQGVQIMLELLSDQQRQNDMGMPKVFQSLLC